MITSPIHWLFLLVAVVVFWSVPKAWRDRVLCLFSAAYLVWLAPGPGIGFVVTAVLFHRLATPVAAAPGRGWLAVIAAAVAALALVKYGNALLVLAGGRAAARIAIPMGISYFVFKAIHYIVEVHRGAIRAPSLPAFVSYMLFFPVFTAGPIERFDHFWSRQSDRPSFGDVSWGLTRIAHGLIKRFVILELGLAPLAGALGSAEGLLANLAILPWYKVVAFLVGALLTTYLDFSAYSDIAIGSSRLFGFRIQENFNWPILARSLQEFWKRWHMSLVNWCQSYIYMPLIGRTRNPYLAALATFVVIALWHDATLNWIAWGLHHGAGLCAHMKWSRFKRSLSWWPKERGLVGWWGWPVTFGYVAASQAYLVAAPFGLYPALRILAKLVFVTLPA